MGASLSRDSCCVGREQKKEDPIASSDLSHFADAVQAELDPQCKQPTAPIRSDTDDRKAPADADCSKRSDSELQDRIDSIVKARVKVSERSSVSDHELKGRINDIVNVLKERAASSDDSSRDQLVEKWNSSVSPVNPVCQVSPAKYLSDAHLASLANLALSGAKERKTPATAPLPVTCWANTNWAGCEEDFAPANVNWARYEEGVAPRKLNFADWDDVPAHQKMLDAYSADPLKVQTRSFVLKELKEIPSPTRRRAKGGVHVEDGAQHAWQKIEDQVEAMEEEEAKWVEEREKKAEMAEMDKVCVEAFLECVKSCSWRERVRTPIKGTNLYIKHMRPCRPQGTSVDVKDSSFGNLRTFLQFLEAEGLLRLQPGLTDPVVIEIRFKACHNYTHAP